MSTSPNHIKLTIPYRNPESSFYLYLDPQARKTALVGPLGPLSGPRHHELGDLDPALAAAEANGCVEVFVDLLRTRTHATRYMYICIYILDRNK